MKRVKDILLLIAFAVFLFFLVLPAALVYFVLSIILAIVDAVHGGVDTTRDALDDIMRLLCNAFEDWLP